MCSCTGSCALSNTRILGILSMQGGNKISDHNPPEKPTDPFVCGSPICQARAFREEGLWGHCGVPLGDNLQGIWAPGAKGEHKRLRVGFSQLAGRLVKRVLQSSCCCYCSSVSSTPPSAIPTSRIFP